MRLKAGIVTALAVTALVMSALAVVIAGEEMAIWITWAWGVIGWALAFRQARAGLVSEQLATAHAEAAAKMLWHVNRAAGSLAIGHRAAAFRHMKRAYRAGGSELAVELERSRKVKS